MSTNILDAGLEPEVLGAKADRLEATLGVLHGSAYVPALDAVRVMKRLAKTPAENWDIATGEFVELAANLRRFASTVARPASVRMLDAADTLDHLHAGRTFPTRPSGR